MKEPNGCKSWLPYLPFLWPWLLNLSWCFSLSTYKIIITPYFTWRPLASRSPFLPLGFQVFLVLWTNFCVPLGFCFILLPLLTLGHRGILRSCQVAIAILGSHCLLNIYPGQGYKSAWVLKSMWNFVIHPYLVRPLIFFLSCQWALNTLANACLREIPVSKRYSRNKSIFKYNFKYIMLLNN